MYSWKRGKRKYDKKVKQILKPFSTAYAAGDFLTFQMQTLKTDW